MKIVVATDLPAFITYAIATWPDQRNPGHWLAPWEKDSVIVAGDGWAICRTLIDDIPPAPGIAVYDDLSTAMAANPTLPWHMLPAFGGMIPESSLKEAYQKEASNVHVN